MDHPWQPTAEELDRLREAILKSHPELARNESALASMVQRAVEFSREWEPPVFGEDNGDE